MDERHAANVQRDRRRVLQLLPSVTDWRPSVRADQVARDLGLPLRSVCHHLHDLQGAGLADEAGGLWRRANRPPQAAPVSPTVARRSPAAT